MESETPTVKFRLAHTGDEFYFSSFSEIEVWLESEIVAWSWFGEQPLSLFGQELSALQRLEAFHRELRTCIYNAKENNSPLEVANNWFANNTAHLVAANSVTGTRVLDVKQALGKEAGAAAYAFAAGYLSFGQITTDNQFRGVLEYCFPKSSDLADTRDRLAAERQNFARTLRALMKSINEQELERQTRDEDWLKARDERLIELVHGLWTTWEGRADAWTNRMDNAENSIRNVEKQFKEFMELKAPVEYWKDQAKKHRNSSRMFAGILALYFVLAILGLREAYFSVGEGLFKSISDADNAGKNILLYYATGGLLVLTTLVFWIGRILSRMYLSEQHLATDATQRSVMTMTYLALIPQSSDDKNSREIILNALFRATSDGVVKDEGGDTNLAMLLSRMNMPR
jgi:hypothetical protein